MSEKEKSIIREMCKGFAALTEIDKARITGIAEGIVLERERAKAEENSGQAQQSQSAAQEAGA